MAEPFRVLSAFVHYELAILPLGNRGDELHRVMVLGRGGEPRIDLDGSRCERALRIAGDDLRKTLVERRVGLIDGLRPGRVKRHADGFGRVRGLNQCSGLSRRFKRVRHNQRDRLASIGDGRRLHGLETLEGMASRHQKAGRLDWTEVVVREDQANSGNGASGARVKTDNASFPNGRNGERCVKNVASRVVGTEQDHPADLVMGVDARGVAEWRIAHGRKALCLAIINASVTVRAPSSILKRLSSLGLAPCNAASPAARAACAVSCRPTSICSAERARHGRVATPPTAMRTSRTASASICTATAAEARAKEKDSRSLIL